MLPRSRKEDAAFRAWMQDHQPDWAEAHRAPGRIGEPDQVWSACQAPWPSAEGYRVVWIHDSGKQLRDAAARARKIEKGVQAIEDDLAARLSSPRTRLRTAAAVHAAAEAALADAGAARWVRFTVTSKTRRQIRMAMKAAEIARIPIYPELRGCAAPSADRIFEIFSHVARHEFRDSAGNLIQVFEPELTELQLKILELLGIPATAYTKITQPRPAAR